MWYEKEKTKVTVITYYSLEIFTFKLIGGYKFKQA